jgi:hypothetical protein
MSTPAAAPISHPAPVPESGLVAALCELIDAVDRRVPHMDPASELRIAKVAVAMRAEAVSRLEELRHAERDVQVRDRALVDAIMSDDGGPTADPPSPGGAPG